MYDWRKALICPKINKRKAAILKYPYFCDLLHEGFDNMHAHCSECDYYIRIMKNEGLIKILEENNLNKDTLYEAICELINNYDTYKKALEEYKIVSPLEKFVKELIGLL